MPIRKIKTGRKVPSSGKKFKPFTYFEGKLKEVQQMPVKKIATVLGKAGVKFSSKKEAEECAKELKEKVISIIENPENAHKEVKERDKRMLFFSVRIPERSAWPRFIDFRLTILPNGRIFLHQYPLHHTIIFAEKGPFEDLKNMLTKGYAGGFDKAGGNVWRYHKRKRVTEQWEKSSAYEWDIEGDEYSVELMVPTEFASSDPELDEDLSQYNHSKVPKAGFVRNHVKPEQILRVNIKLKEKLGGGEIRTRKEFYKKELKGWPIHFIE